MNKKSIAYISFFSIIGFVIFCYSANQSINQIILSHHVYSEIMTIIILVVLCALCHSLPVYLKSDRAIDVSIIIVYLSLLLEGVYICIFVIVLSCLFTIEKKSNNHYHHILNIPFYKTVFNIGNFALSFFIAGKVYYLFGGGVNHISVPGIIMPSLLFLFISCIINSAILLGLIAILHKQSFLILWKNEAISLLPTIFGIAPLGYFMAVLFKVEGGKYLAILFFIPLLVARYSFKLYLDAQTQYYKTVKTLTAAIEAKDKYTEGHSRRVEIYTEKIARVLRLSATKVDSLKVAALLHDIGKIGIEDAILRKPGKLSDDEWNKIQAHPQIGLKILEEVGISEDIKNFIIQHHEKYDGTGYPEHLRSKDMPIESAILSLADAYDAMTSYRPYRLAYTKEEAIAIIKQNSGSHFHPKVVEAFLQISIDL